MALQTDLNVSPYYDDFDPRKDYYKVLFQPGVAVQARELNQLQSILQYQIEKFGDNIFKRGTIIEGCNITRHTTLPYIKINDLSTDGNQVDVSLYDNLYVKNSSNVQAYIVKTEAGFESRSPDLNTLFVKYIASGDDSNTGSFAAGDTLTVYDAANPIFQINVNDGSSHISNSDSVVVMSALAIQNSTGGTTFSPAFAVGDVIQNGVANATIVALDTTSNTEALILRVKPLKQDLVSANSILWRFGQGESVRTATSQAGRITQVIGSGAAGSITTDALGKILSVAVTSQGTGYYVDPVVTVKIDSPSSVATQSDVEQLDLAAQTFLTNITVANSALSPIGVGYGVTVDEGTIYQKGYFSRVSNQLVVVNKYSNTGFTKSVGFSTSEDIINSSQDTTLLDNATGTYNYAAPGADRLKLTPVLSVLDKAVADANTDFLPIIEFADGRPYKQNLDTVYNVIDRQMAQRTYEESGNYVIDPFFVTTKDSSNVADLLSVFKVYIDPGKAYISGERVVTLDNYQANVAKGTDYISNQAATIRLGLGNYVRVKELGGIFDFDTASIVNLYSDAATYVTSNAGSAISAPTTKIGTARVRSVVYETGSGEPGTPTATYRVYLFDINMDSGAAFSSTKSIYYSGGNGAIADVILESGVAVLKDVRDSSLLYNIATATKYANNITYTYRTTDTSLTANTTGYIDISLASGRYFDYVSTLNSSEQRDLVIVPLGNYQATTNAAGTIAVTSGNATIAGTGTAFVSAFSAGDYVKIANSTGGSVQIAQIASIVNSTSMSVTANADITTTIASSGTIKLYYPQNVPISLNNKATRSATVDGSGQVMTVYLGNTVANATSGTATTASVAVTYNAIKNNISSSSKTSNRSVYAKIAVANNTTGGVYGPWALGVSDAFRLRGVYLLDGSEQTITIADPVADVNATADFITYTNNQFANGDVVLYSNTAGTGNIGGLANGTSYYVVYANSTGFALSTSRGGSNVNITTAGTPASDHTFTGNTVFFSEGTYGVVDVTNDFYIDNNQNEDYLDTSYLFLKPRQTPMNANDILLVKFDAFVTTAGGPKTVSSYSVNDSANLATLSSGTDINTLEIPEVYTKSGAYYDLRDQIDFRPVSANTIDYIVDVSSTAAGANALSIINPVEPANTDRFATAIDFPAPDTTLVANVEYYIGRIDRVAIDSLSNFIVRTGVPSVNPKAPAEPKDSITLQLLNIPPYPSLPASLSADMIAIADTKVLNESYGKRLSSFRVKTTLSGSQVSSIQNRGYKMADIAKLEKRIKDLEYYVSFTLAESIAKARFIPSSINATLDRYRFGFFVDPFTDYNYADVQNPEFYATIKEDQLVPYLDELNLEFTADGVVGVDTVTLPYNEVTIITQDDATDGPVETTVANTVTTVANTSGNVVVTTVTQQVTCVTQRQRSYSNNDNGTVYEDFYYTFSSLQGPANFYICGRDNWLAVEVSQSYASTGPWTRVITSASASQITDSDIAAKGLSGLENGFELNGGSLDRKSSGPSGLGGWIEDNFKLNWTHDPATGIYYRVRVYKGGHHGGLFGGQGKSGSYGFKLCYPLDTVTNNTITVSNPATFQYVGMVNTVSPSEFTLSQSINYGWYGAWGTYGAYLNGTYISDSQKFVISVTSLKPNTYHTFTFNGEDQTSKCVQARSSTTNTTGLLSDANGTLTFDFYFDAGITEASTDLQEQNKLAASFAGTKKFLVQSSDGASTASGTIGMKYYTLVDLIGNTFNTTSTVTDTSTSTTVNTTATDAAALVAAMGGAIDNSAYAQALNQAIDTTNVTYVDITNTGIGKGSIIDRYNLNLV